MSCFRHCWPHNLDWLNLCKSVDVKIGAFNGFKMIITLYYHAACLLTAFIVFFLNENQNQYHRRESPGGILFLFFPVLLILTINQVSWVNETCAKSLLLVIFLTFSLPYCQKFGNIIDSLHKYVKFICAQQTNLSAPFSNMDQYNFTISV